MTPRNFWADSPPKSGVAPARFSLFFPVTFLFEMSSSISFSDNYVHHWVKKLEKRRRAVSNSYPLHWLPPDSRFSARDNTSSFATCFLVGWSDRHGFRGNEVGSLQPTPVFCPCPKSTAA